MATRGILVGNGQLWVNSNIIHDHWQNYIKNRTFVPAVPRINMAVKGIASSRESSRLWVSFGGGGLVEDKREQKRYWPIRVSAVLEWTKEIGLGDPEKMMAQINMPSNSWQTACGRTRWKADGRTRSRSPSR